MVMLLLVYSVSGSKEWDDQINKQAAKTKDRSAPQDTILQLRCLEVLFIILIA
jgi:hypothetical protein